MNNGLSYYVIHLLLSGLHVEYVIKSKLLLTEAHLLVLRQV